MYDEEISSVTPTPGEHLPRSSERNFTMAHPIWDQGDQDLFQRGSRSRPIEAHPACSFPQMYPRIDFFTKHPRQSWFDQSDDIPVNPTNHVLAKERIEATKTRLSKNFDQFASAHYSYQISSLILRFLSSSSITQLSPHGSPVSRHVQCLTGHAEPRLGHIT